MCKIFDHYENYSARNYYQVISINDLLGCLPKLLGKIAKDKAEPLLALLPDDNHRAHQISITNVQDLCTALEVAYDWNKRKRKEDTLIGALKKEINETIDQFIRIHPKIDVNKETTIRSAFEYLDYTLKQKILTLYAEHRAAVDAVISKLSLPQVNKESVGAFVKLRNGKTHGGTIAWGDSANIYPALFALEYACFFRFIGLPDKDIKAAILKIF